MPFAVSAPLLCEPDVAFVPVQLPDAVQLVAFVAFHVNVDEPPDAMLPGDAVSVSVGIGAMLTVAVCDAEPPAPVQVNMKFVFADNAPVLCVPEVVCVPVQPPDAEQLVALVELHVSIDEPPEAMLVGAALSITVGIGAAPTETVAVFVAVPPAPEHASV